MALIPVQNRSLADQIFEQLGGEIVAGAYAPGAVLPAERSLSEIFGVNRHVVREALKRLEQVGLVRIAQGGGTRVQDYRRHAGLDLLTMLADHARGGADAIAIWLSVLEMRAAIAADAARLAAVRGSNAQREQLVSLSARMSAADSDARLFDLEVEFWNVVIDASGNLAYRLSFNTMLKGAVAMGEASQKWSAHECRDSGYRVDIAGAIAAGDAERAECVTRSAMRAAVQALQSALAPAESQEPTAAARAATTVPKAR